jgi:polyisoprenoid-binding protein YceI
VEAPISSGAIEESGGAHVQFRVDTAKMHVKPDPKVDAKTESEIQMSMQEKVLESARFPEIVFRSSSIEKQAEGRWRVEGELTLHGVTKSISLLVARSGDAYTGRTTVRQTDFGIKPVAALGGTVKVKNELELEFQVFARR